MAEPRICIDVELTRSSSGRAGGGGGASRGAAPRAYAPRFPKLKEEGWYLVAGDATTHEVLALRRVSVGDRTTVRLALPAVNQAGERLGAVQLYLMSGEYIGLDQQYEVRAVGRVTVYAVDEAVDANLLPRMDIRVRQYELRARMWGVHCCRRNRNAVLLSCACRAAVCGSTPLCRIMSPAQEILRFLGACIMFYVMTLSVTMIVASYPSHLALAGRDRCRRRCLPRQGHRRALHRRQPSRRRHCGRCWRISAAQTAAPGAASV